MIPMIAHPARVMPDENGFQYINYLDFSSDYERDPQIGETIWVIAQAGDRRTFEAVVDEVDPDGSNGAFGIVYTAILGEI